VYARQTLELHSVAPDLIPQDAPATAWNVAQNVFFRNRESYRANGDAPTLAPGRTIRTMIFVKAFGVSYWVYATADGIYAHDGTDEFDITPTGWTPSPSGPTYTSCVLGGVAYINASDRDPVYWAGDTARPCDVLPDWPVGGRCISLRAHRNFLFAIGMISEGEERVRWSDAAEAGQIPDSWTPRPDNFAGFLDLAPLSSPCFDGVTLKDVFLIYKGEAIYSLSFNGDPASVFTARKIFSELGVIAPNAVLTGPDDNHLFVGNDGDVYMTEGVFMKSVLDGRAQREFYRSLSSSGEAIFATAMLMREKLGLISYPISEEGTPGRLLAFDFSSGDIGFRDLPETYAMASGPALMPIGPGSEWDEDDEAWNDDTTAWNTRIELQTIEDVIIGSDLGTLTISSPTAKDFASGPVNAVLQKLGASFGDAEARKQIRRVWPKVTGRDGDVLTFRVGGQEEANGDVFWGPPVNLTIGGSNQIDCIVQGRFMALEVSSKGGGPWRLGTIDVEYRGVGKW